MTNTAIPAIMPQKRPTHPYLFLMVLGWLFLSLASSCSDDANEGPLYEPLYLVDYENLGVFTREQVIESLSAFEFPTAGVSAFMRFDVEAIRIIYKTESYDQDIIQASGLLIVPRGNDQFPALSFQRGTIYDFEESPSAMNSVYSGMGLFFGSTGFITVLPDYIGYGVSSDIPHPYMHRHTMAASAIDMLRAAREYLIVEHTGQNIEDVFMTGYSQGGYATLASLKQLQEQNDREFNVRAVTAGGGPYNKTATLKYLLSADENLDAINTYIWAIDTYNRVYPELNRPYTYYYNEPYASMIAQQGVFAPVAMNPADLFTAEFRHAVLEGTDPVLAAIMADNDVFDWRPDVPLRLYHGTADMVVPFINAQTTYEAMGAAGASDLELIPVPGAGHLEAFATYLTGTFTFFLQLVLSS